MREIEGMLNVEIDAIDMKTVLTYDDKKLTLENIKRVLQEMDLPFWIEQ